MKPTSSVTDWVVDLRRTPLFAILSRFNPGDTPSVGTFYDFFNRLWLLDKPNIKEKLKLKKLKRKRRKNLKKVKSNNLKKLESLNVLTKEKKLIII